MLKPRVPSVFSQPPALYPCSAPSFLTPHPTGSPLQSSCQALLPAHLLELGPLSLQHLWQIWPLPPGQCIVSYNIPAPFRCEHHPLLLQLHLFCVVTSIWHHPLHPRKGTCWLASCREQSPAWGPHLCLPESFLALGEGSAVAHHWAASFPSCTMAGLSAGFRQQPHFPAVM